MDVMLMTRAGSERGREKVRRWVRRGPTSRRKGGQTDVIHILGEEGDKAAEERR